jgi:signal transduction histidine kinase
MGAPPSAAGPLAPGAPLISGVRWGTIWVGVVLLAVRDPLHAVELAWAVALLAHAAWRSMGPRAAAPSSPAAVLAELVLVVLAVATTGAWSSPFVFCLMTALIAGGYGRGFAYAVRATVVTVVAVGLPAVASEPLVEALVTTGQWSIELLLVALLAGYARRMFGEAEARHSLALDRVNQLAEANDLLVSLHGLAQSLPASLNLDEVLTSTVTRLHDIVDCDVAAVLVRDDTTSRWNIAVGEGTRLHGSLSDDELPAALQAVTQSSVASLAVVLGEGEGIGVDLLSRSGVYAPLRARGNLVGLVALEHSEPGRYGRRELQLLDGFVENAALAIDNARWFTRLRAMGADEERVRIARDMHDRVGQSLASLAFKLDRLTTQARGHSLELELDQLRTEVRDVLGDVRAALSDLRTDVSDQQGLVETLEPFLDRVGARTGLDVSFTYEEQARLPLLQERELWRIAQEAVTNVEHHAKASTLRVRWCHDGREATLEVVDDGEGFSVGRDGRTDSFGITGMRERADAIGATLEILSGRGGTTVRCHLETT